jgi:hypothetical protein
MLLNAASVTVKTPADLAFYIDPFPYQRSATREIADLEYVVRALAVEMRRMNPGLPPVPAARNPTDPAGSLTDLKDWCALAARGSGFSHGGQTPTAPMPASAQPPATATDLHAPYMPVDWFKDEFGLTADALAGQKKRGNLATTKRGRWNEYSVPDAMKIWPHVVKYGPDNAK